MKRRLILGWLCMLCVTLLWAQGGRRVTVTGTVIDGDDKSPVPQATVQLLSLPDSTMAVGNVTNNNGVFSLSTRPGKYVLKVSFVGYHTQMKAVELTRQKPQLNVGTITLPSDAVMLSEAVVTAEAPQVYVAADTVGFNASAYRTPEGAMLEELVKKLPGAEVDDDGNVKINGKDIKKVMMNGKEFMGGDVKTALQNLPVDMVDKLKTYDKKSDLARITGIDDGEEETVLDLTVKKGMNTGIFGNLDVAGGTEDRYSARGMVNFFNQDKNQQLTLMGRANNVNDQGFHGGGGGPRWRRNNGLTASKMLAMSFASETEKLELGGSARYNYRDNDNITTGYSENFLVGRPSTFSNSNSWGRSKNHSFNADFRLEWKPDTMTNILFRPRVSYSDSESSSRSQSATFNQDPLNYVDNPNDYLDLEKLSQMDLLGDDPLKDIRVNTANNNSLSESNSLSANATLQVNRKLNSKGRNLTFRGRFSYGDNESDSYNVSDTWYFLDPSRANDTIRRYNTSPRNNYDYSLQLTYSEPIAKATFLQFSYQFKYSYNENDRSTYDLFEASRLGGHLWELGDPLPSNYLDYKDMNQSKYAEYKTYEHEAMVGLRVIREKYQLNGGLTFRPQDSELTYRGQGVDSVVHRSVFNIAPRVDFRYRFNKLSQLRVNYNGWSNQPSMENLLEIKDDSNPLNVTMGNPGLKPSFTHNMNANFNTYNAERQRGIFTFANASMTQNAISNKRTYIEETGGWESQPENINGNWNAGGGFGYNTALKNKKFTIGTFTNVNYRNQVGYAVVDKNTVKRTTTNLNLNERLNGTYRNNWFEFGVNGTFGYTQEKDKLDAANNQDIYTFSYGANTQITLPWKMTLTTNISNQARRGYTDESMNRDELIWNAQLSQSLFKGAASLTFEMYDILKNQSNISRSLTANGRSVYTYNAINSYCMLHFTYRLSIFGSKEMREKMKNRGPGGFGPGRGMGPGPGRGMGRRF